MSTQNLEQGTDDWHAARSGLLTASNFGAAIGINPYQSRQKLWEVMVGEVELFTGNEMTEYGNENEPNAIFDYEAKTGLFVQKTGFWVGEDEFLGASPDGLVEDGLIEVKCPFTQEPHEQIRPYYMAQMQGQMAITKRKWCDFVSWSPDQMNVWRVPFSEEYWELEYKLLLAFWQDVQNMERPKRAKKPVMPDVKVEAK